MKKLATLSVLTAALAASSAFAADTLTLHLEPYYGGTGGGEFRITGTPFGAGYVAGVTANVGGAGGFQSFCLEAAETVNPGTTYNYIIETKAIQGGVGPGGDTLSRGTAWLYEEFAKGTLAGYAFGGTEAEREQSARDLQDAIWWLEDEGGANNGFVALAQAALGGDIKEDYDPTTSSVRVLHLYARGVPWVQDILVYDPPGVPDGGLTLAMLGAGLTGLAFARRRNS
jgi:hypothetical protein